MEQTQILSLMEICEDKNNPNIVKKSTSLSVDVKKFQPRPWRLTGPKDGESFERVTKGGHTFKWNPVENHGTGIWDFVKAGKDGSSDKK